MPDSTHPVAALWSCCLQVAACLDSKAGRRVLAKDLARADVAPERGHRLVTRLPHDDELAHAVHHRLRDASGAQRVSAERINAHSGPRCSPLQELADGILV